MNDRSTPWVLVGALVALAAAQGCRKRVKPDPARRDAGAAVAPAVVDRRPILAEAQWQAIARERPDNRYLPRAARAGAATSKVELRRAIDAWLEVRGKGRGASPAAAKRYYEARRADLDERKRLVEAVARLARPERIGTARAELDAQVAALERWRADTAAIPAVPVRRRYVCHREPSSALFCIDEVELIRHLDKVEWLDEARIFQVLYELEALGRAFDTGNALFHCGNERWSALQTGSAAQLAAAAPRLTAGAASAPARGSLGADLGLSDMLAMSIVCARDQARGSGSRRDGGIGGIGGIGAVGPGPSECAQASIATTDAAMQGCRDGVSTSPIEGGGTGSGTGSGGTGSDGTGSDGTGSDGTGSGGTGSGGTGSGGTGGGGTGGTGSGDTGSGDTGSGGTGSGGTGSGSPPGLFGPVPPPAPSSSSTLVAALRAIAKALGSFGSTTPVDPALDPILSGTWDVSGGKLDLTVNVLGRDLTFDCDMEGGSCPATCREKQMAWEFTKHQCRGGWDVAGSWCAEMTGCKGNCADPTITTPAPGQDDVCSQEISEEELAELRRKLCEKTPYASAPFDDYVPDCDASTGAPIALAERFADAIANERCGPRGYSLDCGTTGGLVAGGGSGIGIGSGGPPLPYRKPALQTEIRDGQLLGRPVGDSSLRALNTFAVDYATFQHGRPPP